MELPIGAAVVCQDGEAGRLKYVAADPVTTTITDLIVEHGMVLKRDRVVPVRWVDRSDAHRIMLNAKLADLALLPEYREVDFMQPDPTYRPVSGHRVEDTRIWLSPYVELGGGRPWLIGRVRLGISDDHAVLVRRGVPVLIADGSMLGRIHHLVADEQERKVSSLVVRCGDLLHREYRMVPIDQVAAISEAGVRLKIDADEVAQLPVYTPPASDAELQARTEHALAHDESTAGAPLNVGVEDGLVRLGGVVAEPIARAAQRLAERVRGVLGVIDETTRPPTPALVIGSPVHALDGRAGTLEKVVVDPHARRVTHLVVGKGWLLKEHRVVPVQAIERVDADGIHLDAAAAEVEQLPVYREEAFITPDPAWEPLADYALPNTLFWGGLYPGVPSPVIPGIEHTTYVGVPEGAIVLRRGVDAFCNNGLVGTLDHMLVDPVSSKMTHLVIEERGTGRRVIAPEAWVRELHEDAIVLHTWNPYQAGVPAYTPQRSDAELATAVRQDLAQNPDLAAVRVDVQGGVAHLEGNVASVEAKADAD
ncbi:MAG: BON domain-containing protein, partial [Chloroflexota bacterium]|nr:BON domain-containing protein [Chloroflexota bacterium]